MRDFTPVEIWIRHGLSDLYFAARNQANDVYSYGTFFYIMAAEKHLKAVLIYIHRDKYTTLEGEAARRAVNGIAKKYSHRFNEMIEEVSVHYNRSTNEELIPAMFLGFETGKLVQTMCEGYMDTRYPSVQSTSRHFPSPTAPGIRHAPLGSSFFTDFLQHICLNCWKYLISNGLNGKMVIEQIQERYSGSEEFNLFEIAYLRQLLNSIAPEAHPIGK